MKLVGEGMTPTEAARKMKIPSRTGRGWARKVRLEREAEDRKK
jgi:transposase